MPENLLTRVMLIHAVDASMFLPKPATGVVDVDAVELHLSHRHEAVEKIYVVSGS